MQRVSIQYQMHVVNGVYHTHHQQLILVYQVKKYINVTSTLMQR